MMQRKMIEEVKNDVSRRKMTQNDLNAQSETYNDTKQKDREYKMT